MSIGTVSFFTDSDADTDADADTETDTVDDVPSSDDGTDDDTDSGTDSNQGEDTDTFDGCTGCVINETCFENGVSHPVNSCLLCDVSAARDDWTSDVGAVCNDGLFCTVDDACDNNGTCSGTKRSCKDSTVCNGEELCDEDAGKCQDGTSTCGIGESCDVENDVCTVVCVGCNINGNCYNNGAVFSSNPCLTCNISVSTDSWSPAVGKSCNDNDLCTYDDACNASGDCAGTLNTCQNEPETCGARRSCNGTSTCEESFTSIGVPCEDGNGCTLNDTCDGFGACVPGAECSGDKPVCRNGVCEPRSAGDPCETPTECSSGFCSDGVCCNENCFRQCEACNVPSSEGTCVFVTTPRTPCQGNGLCKARCDETTQHRSSCLYPVSGTLCGDPASCDDGQLTSAALCDGTGTCNPSETFDCPIGCQADGQPFCASNCPSDQGLCDGSCVDILSSDDHCGVSCTTCGAGTTCSSGTCVATGVHIKINSGGDEVAGGWESSSSYISGGEDFNYGGTHDVSDVTDYAPNEVYQKVHHRDHTYNIPVANGNYHVRIHFTEGYESSAENRRMKYSIEGVVVLEEYNIYRAAGNALFKVVIEEFDTTVSDGSLTINCEASTGDVFEAAVEAISY